MTIEKKHFGVISYLYMDSVVYIGIHAREHWRGSWYSANSHLKGRSGSFD